MREGRDHWYHDLVASRPGHLEPEQMGSEDLLFLLYTSGTTGKPKGIMHTTAGYLLQVAYTHDLVFDLQPDTRLLVCRRHRLGHRPLATSSTGRWLNGVTSVMYEGTPDFPDRDRWWSIIEKYGVTILYTRADRDPHLHEVGHGASREARPLQPASDRLGGRADQPRGLGLVPRARRWRPHPGGRHLVADGDRRDHDRPAPRGHPAEAGIRDRPLPGITVDVVDEAGERVALGGGGYVSSTEPWPGMLRGIWHDDERYQETYWAKYGDRYFAGDGARIDKDGDFWFMGRVDDVMNISGHRISTTEVESALVDHPKVAEAAVVAKTDPETGHSIAAFVTLKGAWSSRPS